MVTFVIGDHRVVAGVGGSAFNWSASVVHTCIRQSAVRANRATHIGKAFIRFAVAVVVFAVADLLCPRMDVGIAVVAIPKSHFVNANFKTFHKRQTLAFQLGIQNATCLFGRSAGGVTVAILVHHDKHEIRVVDGGVGIDVAVFADNDVYVGRLSATHIATGEGRDSQKRENEKFLHLLFSLFAPTFGAV